MIGDVASALNAYQLNAALTEHSLAEQHIPGIAVKAECKDEILELKEKIEALVAMLKQNKA